MAMDIVDETYKLTNSFPKKETFGLTSQARNAAISMAANIAEGSGRQTEKDFSNFIDIAISSGNELITEMLIAQRQKYISQKESEDIISKISEWQNMTYAFQVNNLKKK